MHEHLIKWLSEIRKKNRKRSAIYASSKRRFLGYSKFYCDVRKKIVPGMESKQTYYVINIPYSI